MAQHDYTIANQSGAAFRADLNNALAAAVSQNSGANEPSVTDVTGGDTNGYTGSVILSLVASNGGTAEGTLQVLAEVDATP